MSIVEVRDHVLWAKHVHGNQSLRDQILRLEAGSAISLKIEGQTGTWLKMNKSTTGAPTPGLRPIGPAKAHWQNLFATRRGDVVAISGETPAPKPMLLSRMATAMLPRKGAALLAVPAQNTGGGGASTVQVSDYVIWAKQVHDAGLRDEILAMDGGAAIDLRIEGRAGRWEKMRNAQSGAKTPGIKPMDAARTHWHSLYAERKRAVVEIERA